MTYDKHGVFPSLLQRQKLASSGVPLTKVTLDSFLAWKDRKVSEGEGVEERGVPPRRNLTHACESNA